MERKRRTNNPLNTAEDQVDALTLRSSTLGQHQWKETVKEEIDVIKFGCNLDLAAKSRIDRRHALLICCCLLAKSNTKQVTSCQADQHHEAHRGEMFKNWLIHPETPTHPANAVEPW